MKLKSQVTTELIIITSIVFVIFIGIANIVDDKNTQVIEYRRSLSAEEIADKTAYFINDVFISGYGSRNSFNIPSALIDGYNFTNLLINDTKRIVIIEWDNNYYVAPILTSRISGDLNLSSGEVVFRNVRGNIISEQ